MYNIKYFIVALDSSCNCPTDCDEVVYTQEVSQGKIDHGPNSRRFQDTDGNYLWQLRKKRDWYSMILEAIPSQNMNVIR